MRLLPAYAAQKVEAQGRSSVRIKRNDTDGAWWRNGQPEGEQRHIEVAGGADLIREIGGVRRSCGMVLTLGYS
jgi:hypothetical protein